MEFTLFREMFRKLIESLRIDDRSGARIHADLAGERKRQSFAVISGGLTIRGQMLFPVARPSRLYPVLIICHGIPGSGTARPPDDPGYEALAEEFTSLGIAAVIFNFRGCGDSDGDFDMMGWTNDLEAVLDHVRNTPFIDPTRILVLGFSGGGAAAMYVAADNPNIYGLAVVGTPAHFRIFEKDTDEILADFRERGIIRNPDFPPDRERWMEGFVRIEPLRWVSQFKGKYLLIVHGDADELVPVEHAYELMKHAPAGQAELAIIPGGVHRLRLDNRCISIVKEWVLTVLGWRVPKK